MNERATVRDLVSALTERQGVILRECRAFELNALEGAYTARVYDRLMAEYDRITVARNEITRIMREGV